jgi:hypothetical protein
MKRPCHCGSTHEFTSTNPRIITAAGDRANTMAESERDCLGRCNGDLPHIHERERTTAEGQRVRHAVLPKRVFSDQALGQCSRDYCAAPSGEIPFPPALSNRISHRAEYLAPRAGRGRIAPAIRVRGPRHESERPRHSQRLRLAKLPPHPDPIPARGEREKRVLSATISSGAEGALHPAAEATYRRR